MTGDRLRRSAPAAVTFAALLAWSLYSYLTVRVDGDMVAEVIQVQDWVRSPFWVLSYPGQLHGGIVEYPLIMAAEALTPGNPYGFTLVRILYVPLAGLLACLLLRRAFPDLPLWPAAIGAVVGPAVLHGMMPIKDLYPSSWLLAVGGAYLVYRYLSAPRHAWMLVAGGVLAGLGIYQHPTSAILSIPLLAAGLARWRPTGRQALGLAGGLALGLVPLVMALRLQPDHYVVFLPAKLGLPQAAAAFGLSTAPTAWAQALVPQGWGILTTDLTRWALGPVPQLVLNAALAVALLAALVLAVPAASRALRGRGLDVRGYTVVLWGSAVVMVVVLVAVVPPLFFYGAGLAFLVWMTLALLPRALPGWPGILVTAAVVVLMAAVSLGSFLWQQPRLVDAARVKAAAVREMRDTADGIAGAGIGVIYGDYWEVMPIAYASDGRLHPLTTQNSRFPLTGAQAAAGTVVVAVPDGRTALPSGLDRWTTAQQALNLMAERCTPLPDRTASMPRGVQVFECPVDVVNTPQAPA